MNGLKASQTQLDKELMNWKVNLKNHSQCNSKSQTWSNTHKIRLPEGQNQTNGQEIIFTEIKDENFSALMRDRIMIFKINKNVFVHLIAKLQNM